MTWSPFFSDVTPGPTSTTTPAPSWPKMTGNRPSGSAPERVNSSVWHTPLARISMSTSPALGPASSSVTTSSGLPAAYPIAALVFMPVPRSMVARAASRRFYPPAARKPLTTWQDATPASDNGVLRQTLRARGSHGRDGIWQDHPRRDPLPQSLRGRARAGVPRHQSAQRRSHARHPQGAGGDYGYTLG